MILDITTTPVSNFVEGVDKAFLIIFSVAMFFLVGITLVMLYFIYRYRKSKNPVATQIHGSTTLEIIWTVIPTIIVLVLFYYGWAGWLPQSHPPKDAFPIKATGRMWSFSFEYPNGRVTDTLYVPAGKPVNLELIATDVIHSFYIPSFMIKADMNPGRNGMMWFIANHEGVYDIFCAEYCGLQHSYMKSAVVSMSPDKFDDWIKSSNVVAENSGSKTNLEGAKIVRKLGCVACHTLDGTKLVGPSFKGIYGAKRTVLIDGAEKEVTADDAYLKEAIMNPSKDVVKGYPVGLMQPYTGQISDDEMGLLMEYFKSLSK